MSLRRSDPDAAPDDGAPFRVLPLVDDSNRGFWTSGADGRLRFSRCQACGYWLHPPDPALPGVRRPGAGVGAGQRPRQVFSYTVNHQPWDGSTEPWAIVLVALPEQDGLRLTSNLVGSTPTRCASGCRCR